MEKRIVLDINSFAYEEAKKLSIHIFSRPNFTSLLEKKRTKKNHPDY